MSVKNIVKAIPLTSVDSATFTGSYVPLNAAGFPAACYILRVSNHSNVPITISYDGTTDNEYLLASTDMQLTFQGNLRPNAYGAVMPAGTVVYIKGAQGVGLIYLSGYYQPQGI